MIYCEYNIFDSYFIRTKEMDRWTDRVVLVTGASSGIGRSIVVELSKYPLKIVAVARRINLLQVLLERRSLIIHIIIVLYLNIICKHG